MGEKFCFKNITNNTYAKIKYDELLQYQINFYCKKKRGKKALCSIKELIATKC